LGEPLPVLTEYQRTGFLACAKVHNLYVLYEY